MLSCSTPHRCIALEFEQGCYKVILLYLVARPSEKPGITTVMEMATVSASLINPNSGSEF